MEKDSTARAVAKVFARAFSVFAMIALASITVAARADSIADYVHLELGAGVSRYDTQGDGTWYQEGMQHDLGLSAPVLLGGLTGPLYTRESWGIDWHIDYVSLGHVSSQCECTPIDANYSTTTHSLIANPVLVPNADFVGNGSAQGVALTVEPYFRYRGWRVGAEAGLFPYRPDWDVTVTGWVVQPGNAPQTVYADTPHGIQLGKVAGLSVGRGAFSVAYQHYFLPTRFDMQHSPAIWKGADVILLKYRY
jgi:hypothetical protein